MKSLFSSRKTGTDSNRLFSVMNAIAWLVLGAGLLLCLLNVNEFNDQNLGLMIGIGCLIASVQIYVIGTVVNLVQNNINTRTDP
jgi:cell division protein FtsW (lipid II flippase)